MKNILSAILACFLLGANAQDSPGAYTVQNVRINTSLSDFGTAFLGDNKIVFAAPKEGFTFNREEYNSQPFLDLYMGEVTEDGQLIHKQKMPGEINSKFHEGMVTFSKDMKTVYFSANGRIKRVKRRKPDEVKTAATATIQLFKATIDENGEWGKLEMLPFNGKDFSTGHPVLNRDDTKLYFVSDRPESLGKTDIFVVDVYPDGTYGEPVNLGPQINTPEREMFPFIGKDNVLYFSSDGYSGYGALDVYASKIFDTTVSDPINLGEPVNSEMDDFAYIIDDTKHKGYFSSNREGGKGDDDIYSFVASPPIRIECQQEISGVVRDIDSQELIPNVKIILFDQEGKELKSFLSNSIDASFSFSQACNTRYKIKGFLEGYMIGELDIQTVNDLSAEPIEIVMNMEVDPTRTTNPIAGVEGAQDAKSIASAEPVDIQNESLPDDASQPEENLHQVETDDFSWQVAQSGSEKDSTNGKPIDAAEFEHDQVALNEFREDKTGSSPVIMGALAGGSELNPISKGLGASVESREGISQEVSSPSAKPASISTGSVQKVPVEQKSQSIPAASSAQGSQIDATDFEHDHLARVEIEERNGFNINTIYFDFDKSDIRYDARIELDKLVNVLRENPDMKIEISSHTDIRGTEKYNAELSDNRAKQTIQYLVDKGIDPGRISGRGFGETLVAEKCSDASPCNGLQHQLNRRSEFVIFQKDNNQIVFRSNNRRPSLNPDDNPYTAHSGLFANYDFSDDDPVYTVQVGAFKGKVQTDRYSKLTNLFNHRYEDGLNRYYSGIFETSQEAKNHLRTMQRSGYSDAFVVGLKGEDRF